MGRSLPADWVSTGRPFERRLLDAALEAIAHLSGTQGEQVLVNQDMHADNVLHAEREPWLAIDPKPLAGEREFGIAALVRGGELGEGRDDVLHRWTDSPPSSGSTASAPVAGALRRRSRGPSTRTA